MRLLIITCLLFQACIATSQEFDWLLGNWERVNLQTGKYAMEIWKKSGDEMLSGKGFMVEDGDTVFTENLSIVKKGDHWYYIADVSHNSDPVSFKIHFPNHQGFRAENSAHDFPKVIEYRRSESELIATISAGDKIIAFSFIKRN